jgi:hypothetical protein
MPERLIRIRVRDQTILLLSAGFQLKTDNIAILDHPATTALDGKIFLLLGAFFLNMMALYLQRGRDRKPLEMLTLVVTKEWPETRI